MEMRSEVGRPCTQAQGFGIRLMSSSKRQRVVGLDRSPAGVHECDVVFLRLEGFQRTTVLGKVLKEVEEERTHFLAVQQLR